MKLRPYQAEALAARRHRQLTVLPTGTGKTRIFCEIAAREAGRVWICVHRDELVDQTRRALRTIAPGRKVAVLQGQQSLATVGSADVVIAMQQTLGRLGWEQNPLLASTAPAVAIIDEAHRYTTRVQRALLDALEAAGAGLFGFTATPQIHNSPIYGPGMPWTGISYRRSIVAMIREGYLSDVRGLSVTWPDLDLRKVKQSRGDYTASSLGAQLSKIRAPERIAEAWGEHAKGRERTLVFVPTVELGRETTAAFRKLGGVDTREVYGSTPVAERRRTIAAFRQGECPVLVNVLVGAEGFDVPEVDCIVMARPTRSWTLHVQTVGRGLRPAPGKTDLLVLDIAGNAAEHDLVTLPKALEVATLKRGQSVREATEGRTPREVELDHGAAVLEETLLYTPVAWHRWHDEFVAPMTADEVCVVAPVEEQWGVFRFHVRSGSEREIACFDYPAEAQETAEEYIRQEGDAALFRRAKAWRREPPTAAQLRWFRGAAPPATRGEASERITLALYQAARLR